MAGIIKTSINLTKIPKDKIIDGAKGKYLPITITVNEDVDQFGNHGPVVVSQTKEERDAKVEKIYLGNTQVVWTNGAFPEPNRQDQAQPAAATPQPKQPVDDLPF